MDDKHSVVLWSARALAILMSAFLALFALDAWSDEQSVWRSAGGVLIHLLPSALVLGVILVSWRRQWIGGVAFVVLAIAYAVIVRFRLDWVAVISGPLLVIALLYLWSWWSEHVHLQAQ